MSTPVDTPSSTTKSAQLPPASNSLYPLLESILSSAQLEEIVGPLGKSAELFEELKDVSTVLVNTQEINKQQYDQGSILEQRNKDLESRIEAEESQYIALERVWKDSQERHKVVVDTLNETIAHLRSYSATDATIPRASTKSAKFEVSEFDGTDRSALRSFLFSINAKFNNNAGEFPDMQTKLVYYTTKLKGAAYDLIEHALEEDGSVKMTDVQEITDILKISYTDVDAAETAATELRALQQGEKETFALFIAKFQALARKTTKGDEELIRELRESIKTDLFVNVNDLQSYIAAPTTFTGYIQLCRKQDAIMRQNAQQALIHRSGRGSLSVQKPVVLSKAATDYGDPMDISKMDISQLVHGRLHPEERQRRLDFKLCMYDGEKHLTSACPKLLLKEKRAGEALLAAGARTTAPASKN